MPGREAFNLIYSTPGAIQISVSPAPYDLISIFLDQIDMERAVL